MSQTVIIVLVLLPLVVCAAVYFALRGQVARALREVGRLRGEVEALGLARLAEEMKQGWDELREATERALSAARPAEVAGGDAVNTYVAPSNAQDVLPAADESNVFSLAALMDEDFNRSTHPADLLPNDYFRKGVEVFKAAAYSVGDLLAHAHGGNVVVACMALQALAERESADAAVAPLVARVNEFFYWPRFYALSAVAAHAGPRAVVAELLLNLNSTWTDYVPLSALRDFVARRVAAGEEVSFGERLNSLTEEQAAQVSDLLDELRGYAPESLTEEFTRWRAERVNTEFLKTFGRVWERGGSDDGQLVMLPSVEERLLEIETALRKDPPRSVMLVGESGTGKTTLARALARKLQREGWTIFEASAADVLAGQKYLGELEGRVQTLVRQIGGKRVLWIVPAFAEMLWAGQHQYSPTGILDHLTPQIESGELKVVGELSPAGYETLVRRRPKLRAAMETVRVAPTTDAETLELAARWAEMNKPSDAPSRLAPETLRESFQLTRQYLGDKAAPGNLVLLLDNTHRRLLTEQGGNRGQVSLDDILVTLSQLTGLPTQILDDRAGLDLTDLRDFFERRVIGQPEAVDCLVERVAMVKAGLTDPTRPQGVFLFVGPTGTGKTEIAKTLAEFLFGSPERMIRLDMSEFQTPESLDRILGDGSDAGDSTALVNAVRKQPFSVILLDEFEKAHPQVWDLFLQVFDDGRLTDRRGATADFRHAVVILTSNLGATLPAGASVGFAQEQSQFTSTSVERAVGRSFRREFINRIDRVVVFRPLSMSAMRDILRKELGDVLGRRGFRTRQWAVEWDESAIDFLLRKGFTADLGARPLKRAIERYLLAPLSVTIVNHQFPEGDQFLFVRAGTEDQIEVEFVDPDAPEPAETVATVEEEESFAEGARELRLESIALDARGTPAEVQLLRERYERLRALVDSDDWQTRKQDALLQTARPDFWSSPERFSVLGLAEYMDRIEAGLDTAGSLLGRLAAASRPSSDGRPLRPDLVERVAQQLYLIESARGGLDSGHARDAFLLVQAAREAGADAEASNRFARRVAEMYRRWAERRRMRFSVLEEREGGDADGADVAAAQYRCLISVSGFGAYPILRAESGLHVLETPQDEKGFNRAKVQVRVVPQPDEPAGHAPDALRRQAERALSEETTPAPPAIVRRYREEPSPLVRDSARGWRTGKIERVLGGDFDLMS